MGWLARIWGALPFWAQDGLIDLLPLALVAVLVWVYLRARQTPLWAEAFRRLRSDRAALFAMAVLGFFLAVALADSIGWRDSRAADFRTALQRVAERKKEYYYSAPLATMTTGEPHPRSLIGRHLLGTDAVGNDVLFQTLRGARTALMLGALTLIIMT